MKKRNSENKTVLSGAHSLSPSLFDGALYEREPLLRAHSLTLNPLNGGWKVFQLKRGHRFAVDDLVTAWEAWKAQPQACSLLDLGAGSGALGLMVLRRLSGEAHLTSVEWQPLNLALQRCTRALNGLDDRMTLVAGDLRTPNLFKMSPRFDLIVSNPPYLSRSKSFPSPYPHRVRARLETHGDIYDFSRCAAGLLAKEGLFVFCFAAQDERPLDAIEKAGLHLVMKRRVFFHEGRAPRLRLYVCAHRRKGRGEEAAPLVVRGKDGRLSEGMRCLRSEMDFA